MAEPGDIRPVPDPSTLTTEALKRDIAAVRELMEIQVTALDRFLCDKFATMEAHRQEQKADSDASIHAALTAVKEENAKTAASTAKQIDSLKTTFDTAIGGLTTNLNDVKDRMTKAEGNTGGQVQARASLQAWLSAAVAAIVIVGFVLALRGSG